ncbi:uncharacterized protein LOC131284129 [Anopheles ziemanni]|uniref:uncharacterized protein LOC131271396 n=1 Tax=Anopheles coustani TaxID=139045 RepID=UPI0026595543|nr:uncharacterized protein LOC131271396 [Anopheles coustani]XP_058168965.1 uncharacterized protein LOC131284129 [Anopheles ziemanni]
MRNNRWIILVGVIHSPIVYVVMGSSMPVERQERAALAFPVGGSMGYLLAIAIPLLVPDRNIYLSHNFEANYGVPTNATQYSLWYQRFKDNSFNLTKAIETNRRHRRQAGFSRTYFYGQLEERMELYGLNSSGCMQRIICELTELPLPEHNGVVGDVISVIFSPSSSMDEDLPVEYFKAEASGANDGCERYRMFCSTNLLRLISTSHLEPFLEKMLACRSCFIVLGVCVLTMAVGQTNPANDVVKSRQKRIAFPLNAAMGIIFAIAVPLGIPDRNIFMSYNFEGNYNNPADANIFSEGFANYIKGIVEPLTAPSRPVESYGIRKRSADKRDDLIPVTAQITRRQIYKMLRKQLKGQHFHGKKCLLRMICDAALHPFRETNGVIGDLVQIMLSPSSSMDENLPKEYLLAEVAGSNGSCDQYRTDCPKDPLEFVSFLSE